VLAHDLGADEEPEPRSAAGLLRREEGLEDPFAVRRSDARSGVGDGDFDFARLPRARRRRHDPPSPRRRVDRVGQKVQDHLLELVRVAPHQRQARLGVDRETQPGAREPWSHQIGGVPNEPLEVDGARFSGRTAGDVQQSGDDVDDACDLRHDDGEAPRDVVGQHARRQVLAEQLEMSCHRVQRRADLVCHLGHDAPREPQPLGVAQAALHLEEQRIETLDLLIAPVELTGRLADARS
jgi:hypothetical protein